MLYVFEKIRRAAAARHAPLGLRRRVRQRCGGQQGQHHAFCFASPISVFFLASSTRPHPVSVACPDENRHIGSTSIAASPPVYRLSAQKPDKPVLAIRCPPYWGQKAEHPHAYALPFHHAPSGEDTAASRMIRDAACVQIRIPAS